MAQRTLFTIGHSTRPWQEFVELLQNWKVACLVDVRTVPQSRAFPWFSKVKMELALRLKGIRYIHLPELGGLRHAKRNSINAGWRNASFRGYADYMQSDGFEKGLKLLVTIHAKIRACDLRWHV
jgi:uncharacterized protein (DUF488 family)